MPLQVVAGSLESERARRDSGVCGMKGIMSVFHACCLVSGFESQG